MLKKVLFLVVLLAFCFGSLRASHENFPLGARSAGLAHASVTLSDVWSVHNNQAGLAFLERPTIGVYSESRFLVPGLGLAGFAGALPVGNGAFGFTASTFGFSAYNESKLGLSYARKFGENLSIGIQLDYLRTVIGEGYGTADMLSAEIGILAKITDKITLGAHVFNPNRARVADFDEERTPAILRLGFQYDFSEQVLIVLEAQKDIDHPAVFKVGLEYHISDPLYLRAGVSTDPFLNTFGFGLELKNFNLNFGAGYHSVLGFSPQVGLNYTFQ